MATATATTALWLTDRTRFKLGTQRCPRARYLGYHAGTHGYGWTHVSHSLPLATGSAVHEALAAFTTFLKTRGRVPSAAEARDLMAPVVDRYTTTVEAGGFRGVLAGADTEQTITEQATLIASQAWVLWKKFLPWLHETYEVVSVEEERPPYPLAPGLGLMLRTDLLARRRTGKFLAYFECKTTGWDSDAWAEQWETDPQLALGTLDVEAQFGAEVSELYVIALNKGRRLRDRKDPQGRKKQYSPLCYGYRRAGNPPLAHDQWLPAYEWTDAHGETKRVSRAHERTGIWELEQSDDPVWLGYRAHDPLLTPAEYWVRALPESVLDKVCYLIGPLNRQDWQLGMTLRGMAGEERRWQEALWRLYELDAPWPDDAFQRELDRLIPCSWACRPFGAEHECEFVPICHKHTGWDDPVGSGKYQPRLPHHRPELTQAVDRGLIPAEAAAVAEEE